MGGVTVIAQGRLRWRSFCFSLKCFLWPELICWSERKEQCRSVSSHLLCAVCLFQYLHFVLLLHIHIEVITALLLFVNTTAAYFSHLTQMKRWKSPKSAATSYFVGERLRYRGFLSLYSNISVTLILILMHDPGQSQSQLYCQSLHRHTRHKKKSKLWLYELWRQDISTHNSKVYRHNNWGQTTESDHSIKIRVKVTLR